MKYKFSKDIVAYQEKSVRSQSLICELLHNAYRTIKSVYMFENFDEYCRQLKSDKQEDKLKIYWKTSYDEKLIDKIKISVAFENFNKAVLLKNGIVVHSINHKFDKKISSRQKKGIPIKVSELFENGFESINLFEKESKNFNAFYENFNTINYSSTLNENYQNIIGIEKKLILELLKINQDRNRLHFFTEFSGAFMVRKHIEKWNYIMTKSIEIIETEYRNETKKLKNI
tara:strand:+ start:196 stop:882 length:687 start_codon:yes stop_codon:yes gene_type:complete